MKQATQAGGAQTAQQTPQMGGMMMSRGVPNLKTLDPEDRVRSLAYCRDTYEVTTADGQKHKFWERNLRLKTDSSEDAPHEGIARIGSGRNDGRPGRRYILRAG